MGWATFYYFCFYNLSKQLIDNPKYESAYKDFIKSGQSLKFIIGDPEKNSEVKYLAVHFVSFFTSIPLAIVCYHSFFINTLYLIFIVIFLIYNGGTKSKKAEEKKDKQIDDLKKTVSELEAKLNQMQNNLKLD
jgi:hypothetical protein